MRWYDRGLKLTMWDLVGLVLGAAAIGFILATVHP